MDSEINWIFKKKKLQARLTTDMFKASLSFMFFPVLLNGWKKCATTLLPNNWLSETPQTLLRRLGRQSAERKGSGF
ncbi:hypothetical protein JMN23_03270 [Bacillus sp. RHFB]|nr:hypothetical protein [Bacillus sp. RHFB]